MRLFNKNKELVGFIGDSSDQGITLKLLDKGTLFDLYEKSVSLKSKQEGRYSKGDIITLEMINDKGEKATVINKLESVCVPEICDRITSKVSITLSSKKFNKRLNLVGIEHCFVGYEQQ